ncbi:hypothetical protein L914_00087, partial [Phytophthora nicotianae]
ALIQIFFTEFRAQVRSRHFPGYDPINVDTSVQHIGDSLAALRNTFEQIHRGVADQRDK